MKRTKVRQPKKELSLYMLKKILPERHKMFCHEYIINGWNASKAYAKVYGAHISSGPVNACYLLKKPNIVAYIGYVKTDHEMICGISKSKVAAEFKKIAFSSVRHLHQTWIDLKEFDKLVDTDPDVLDAIESIETKTENRIIDKELVKVCYVKLKLYSKVQALEGLNKLMGYNEPDKQEIKTNTDINIAGATIEAIREAFGLNSLINPIQA